MTTPSAAVPRPYPGRALLVLGLALAALGVVGYLAQLWAGRLTAPWYLPGLTTLGVVFVVASLWQGRTVWRVLGLLLAVLLVGVAWAIVLGERLPAYTGPVAAGQPFPEFATMQADGSPFTRHDLEGDRNNVLVFFRGRW
jgi:hypothetical protein